MTFNLYGGPWIDVVIVPGKMCLKSLYHIPCGKCGKLVSVMFGEPNLGVFPSRDYVLVADSIFHTDCWDELSDEDDDLVGVTSGENKTCSTCRHSVPALCNRESDSRSMDEESRPPIKLLQCKRWKKGYGDKYSSLQEHEVLVENDEGWAMVCGPKFGCLLHEPKEKADVAY